MLGGGNSMIFASSDSSFGFGTSKYDSLIKLRCLLRFANFFNEFISSLIGSSARSSLAGITSFYSLHGSNNAKATGIKSQG
jgi:hypothetical protein